MSKLIPKWLNRRDVTSWRTAVSALRSEYTGEPLVESNLGHNPLEVFEKWFAQAVEKAVFDANSFVLSTVDSENKPHSRVVLLKGFDEDGFLFFTNYESEKSQHIFSNPNVALNFHWPELFRQVRIEGLAEKSRPEESDQYFASRPRKSNLSALASRQSSKIAGREELESNYQILEQEWAEKEVIQRPDNWGGFRVLPTKYEFWQGRTGRLHDRIVFDKNKDQSWMRYRLAP